MYSKLQYIIILLIATAVFLSSCQSDPPGGESNVTKTEIQLAAHDAATASRASITTNLNTLGSKFAVYGDMKSLTDSNAEPISIFNNTEVAYIDGIWSYQKTQYWIADNEYSFTAIHPASVIEPNTNSQYSDSRLSLTYILPTMANGLVNSDDIKDVVVATHRRLYESGSSVSAVSFSFGHLLSLINFSVELTAPSARSEECFKIHKIEMSGFGTSTTINVEPAPLQSNNQTNDSQIEIVTAKGNGSLEINFDEPIEVINGAAAVKMFDSNNAIIMLPQTFEGNDKVQIRLTYTANNDAEETQVSATLSNFTWEWGKSYIYKIKLELEQKEVNMVISNATIVPWNLVEGPDIVDAR